MLHIRVIDGPNAGEEIKTHESSLRIGRAKECRLTLSSQNTSASRVHVEVYCAGARTMVRDLISKHGTIVQRSSGQRVELTPLAPECEVVAGDRFTIGLSTLELLDIGSDSQGLHQNDEMTMVGLDPVIAIAPDDQRQGASDQLLKRFLQLPTYDPTNLNEAKLTLAEALLNAFPQAASVSVVELNRPAGEQLERDDLDMTNIVAVRSKHCAAGSAFSFSVMRDTHRRRAVVCYGTPQALPETESVRGATMGSCMCAPITEGRTTVGFIQIFTSQNEPRFFGHRDVHVFGLLSSVAALLIRQAKAAREHAVMRTMASVGQVVAGLSHDARGILSSVGTHAATVEKRHPALAEDRGWGYVREDLEMLRLLTQDTSLRISANSRPLELQHHAVRGLVDSVLDRCRRYFIEEGQRAHYILENRCSPQSACYADLAPLTMALMNAVKNAIDAYRDRSCPAPRIVVTSNEQRERGGTACVISILDDAGGIPADVLNRLGQMLVTTKGSRGTGLGMCIVIESLARLNGRVVLATSRDTTEHAPAGSIVSLYLPKNSATTIINSDSLIVSSQYEQLRRAALGSA